MNVQIDYILIGQRIRDCRIQAHLTQAELAERSGICPQYIGNLERGKGIPSLSTVLSLCSALDVEPNVLLLGVTQRTPEEKTLLGDIPSIYSNTLTALWMEAGSPGSEPSASFNPAAFPSFDLTLEDDEDHAD